MPYVGWVSDFQGTTQSAVYRPNLASPTTSPYPHLRTVMQAPSVLDTATERRERDLEEQHARMDESSRRASSRKRQAKLRHVAMHRRELIKKQREKERLDAPRRYASSLTATKGPQYTTLTRLVTSRYLAKNARRPLRDQSPPKKRIKCVVDRWVYGPSEKHQLADGESELVQKLCTKQCPVGRGEFYRFTTKNTMRDACNFHKHTRFVRKIHIQDNATSHDLFSLDSHLDAPYIISLA